VPSSTYAQAVCKQDAKQTMASVRYLHRHEAEPRELLTGAPSRAYQPQQHHAQHQEGHHCQAQPQLQQIGAPSAGVQPLQVVITALTSMQN